MTLLHTTLSLLRFVFAMRERAFPLCFSREHATDREKEAHPASC